MKCSILLFLSKFIPLKLFKLIFQGKFKCFQFFTANNIVQSISNIFHINKISFFRFLQLITPLPTIRAEIEDLSYLVYRFGVKTSFITSARAKAAFE